MLRWLTATLQEAGLGRLDRRIVIVAITAICLFAGWCCYLVIPIPAFAACIAFVALGLLAELLQSRSKSRRRAIAKAWPAVLDALISGVASGVHASQTFAELAENGPPLFRGHFAAFSQNLEYGATFRQALGVLKIDLGEVYSDRLVELLLIAESVGGAGFYESLKAQASVVRQDLALWGEIEAKQSWVTGTAKIAIASPWIIVALLSIQPGNLAVYASGPGSIILIVGLAVSLFAYRLIQLLGGLESPPRVFAQ